MAVTADKVIVEFEARLAGYNASVAASAAKFQKATHAQEAQIKSLERTISASSGQIGSTLKGLGGALATAFSLTALKDIADGFTRIQNSLKVAGLEGSTLAAVQEKLFRTAQQYGAEYEALVGVYSKAAQAQKELGASNAQILQLTEAVSAALKVQGGSAESASGALLQLGQALGSGKVQAEEWNSIVEGAYPLAQAAARGMDGMGGSVAKLKQEINAGNVTSRELFDSILKGAPQTIATAESATLTLSGAFTTLNNALVQYVGGAATANGITEGLSVGIKLLADNVSTIATALAIVAAVLGAKYVASIGAATIATIAKSAADVRATLTTEALAAAMVQSNGLMLSSVPITNAAAASVSGLAVAQGVAARAGSGLAAVMGGTVGIAVLAAVGGLVAFSAASKDAEQRLKANAQAADELGISLSEASQQALSAADENAGLGGAASTATPKMWSFKNSVDGLTESLYEQAKAARAARVEMLQKQLDEAKARRDESAAATSGGASRLSEASNAALRQGDILGSATFAAQAGSSQIMNLLTGGRTGRDGARDYTDSVKVVTALADTIDRLRNSPIGKGDLPIAGGGGGDTGKKGKTKKATGPTEQEIADRFLQELSHYYDQELQLRGDLTADLVERSAIEREAINNRLKADVASINADEDYNAEQKKTLVAAREHVAMLEAGNVNLRENQRLQEEQLATLQAALDSNDELLNLQAGLATTAAERLAIERKLLANARKREEAELKNIIDDKGINRTFTPAQVSDAEARMAALPQIYAEKDKAAKDSNLSPLERLRKDVPQTAAEINEALEGVAANGLQSLNDGITDALLGTKSLGEVFRQVAQQIIADLLRIQIQQMMFGKSSSGGGGLLSGLMSAAGAAFGGGSTGPSPISLSQTMSDLPFSGSGLPGFASGGSMTLGGRPGVDRNMLSLNGQPIARVSSGEQLNINNPRLTKMGRDGGSVSATSHIYNLSVSVASSGDDRRDRRSGQQAAAAFRTEMTRFNKMGG